MGPVNRVVGAGACGSVEAMERSIPESHRARSGRSSSLASDTAWPSYPAAASASWSSWSATSAGRPMVASKALAASIRMAGSSLVAACARRPAARRATSDGDGVESAISGVCWAPPGTPPGTRSGVDPSISLSEHDLHGPSACFTRTRSQVRVLLRPPPPSRRSFARTRTCDLGETGLPAPPLTRLRVGSSPVAPTIPRPGSLGMDGDAQVFGGVRCASRTWLFDAGQRRLVERDRHKPGTRCPPETAYGSSTPQSACTMSWVGASR